MSTHQQHGNQFALRSVNARASVLPIKTDLVDPRGRVIERGRPSRPFDIEPAGMTQLDAELHELLDGAA